ncbi:unnamed protein product [Porites lobata]|uniref:G-protein coupled receptors family 1 profile domain-containing protein n=1 Tax=Porites lobata TaxID=104759 RepID=A0ABN8QFR6_9CNID|nr:unnamed protein product [Porites lobata]
MYLNANTSLGLNLSDTSENTAVPNSISVVSFIGIFILCFYIIVYSTSTVGNFVVLYICHRSGRSAAFKPTRTGFFNRYIANLAIADLLFTQLTVFDAVYAILADWVFGAAMCKLQGFLVELCYSAAILTLIAISRERRKSISDLEMKSRIQRVKERKIFSIIVWIVAFVLCSPLLYAYNVVKTQTENVAVLVLFICFSSTDGWRRRRRRRCAVRNCAVSSWSSWSSCTANQCLQGGSQRRTRWQVTTPLCGGLECPSMEETRQCYGTRSVNCQLSSWSEWSSCSTPLGVSGIQTSSRHRIITEQCGGTCSTTFRKTRSCPEQSCLNGGSLHSNGTCFCNEGFSGDCCQKKLQEGEKNDEKGKSDESLNGNGTCLCKELEGYSGDCCKKELQEGKL